MEYPSLLRSSTPPAASPTREFLSLRVGDAEYGIDLRHVLETRSWEAPRPVAQLPAFIRGLIDLRGCIVPIVDLRLKLRLARAECDASTPVVIVRVAGHTIGLVVDGVADVVALHGGQLLPAPDFVPTSRREYVKGLASTGERMLILLDLDALLASEDTALIDQVS